MKKPKIKTTRRSASLSASAKQAQLSGNNQQKISWTKRSSAPLANALSSALNPYILYTDGSYFYEFKKAGIGGYLLSPNHKTVFEFSCVLNNPNVYEKHEIMALEAGLLKAHAYHIKHLKCFTDDQKLAQILNIRNPTQRSGYIQSNPYLQHVNVLLHRFDSIEFEYLPRTKNKRADKLSRREVLKEISHLTRVMDNALAIKNFICTQHYSMNNLDKFSALKNDIQTHLAFHLKEEVKSRNTKRSKLSVIPEKDAAPSESDSIESRPLRYRLEVFKGVKRGNHYQSEKIASSLLKTDWFHDALKQMALYMKKDALRRGEAGEENLTLIVALKDKQKILDNFLRGQSVLKPENKKTVEMFESACSLYKTVVLHSDDTWLKSIFNENLVITTKQSTLKTSNTQGASNVHGVEFKNKKPRKELDYLPLPDEDEVWGSMQNGW